MKSKYIIYVHVEAADDIDGELDVFPESLFYDYFLIGDLLEENKLLFEESCLCNPSIMEGLRDECSSRCSFYFVINDFKVMRLTDVPSQGRYNLKSIKNPELKQALEELRLRYSVLDNKNPAPVAAVPPAAPADITSIRPYPQIFAQGNNAAPVFDDNGAAGMVVAVEILEKQNSMDKKLDSMPEEIANAVVQRLKNDGKIDSLDKIPELDKESGEWLIASEYARTRKPPITVDTLKQGRSNVKKKNGKTKGEVADDNSEGIHGKHVWRFDGLDKNGNEIYYYYIYGVDGKYTP